MTRGGVAFFMLASWACGFLMHCSPAMKQAEERVLNVADVVCAIDNLDPGLPPADVQAAIAAACGKAPDLHKIVDAQKRALARVAMRPAASAAPAPSGSAR
jgi:hypothetical protein